MFPHSHELFNIHRPIFAPNVWLNELQFEVRIIYIGDADGPVVQSLLDQKEIKCRGAYLMQSCCEM